jgi:hypothetical protein
MPASVGAIARLKSPLSLVATLGKVILKVQPFEPVLMSRKSPP